jgi:hypothetical protein
MHSRPKTLRTRGPLARLISRLPVRFARPLLAMGACALLCLSACMTENDKSEADSIRVRDSIHVQDSLRALPMIFAVTSDYKTGSYAVHGLDSAYTKTNIDPIHSDAVVRYLGGNDIFIVNRLKRDNLQIVDRHNLKTVLQIALPALSNPQDVALKDSLIYVAYFAVAKIGIYRQSDGAKAGEIDISAYADTADNLPETAALTFVGGDLFALLQNLDVKNGYVPLTARLLKIDPAAKTVKKSLDLPYGNPASMTWDSSAGRLYIPCRAEYSNPDYSPKADGGILSIDPATLEVADTVATEEDLGGNVNDVTLFGGNLIMDLSTSDSTGTPIERVITIPLKDGSIQDIIKMDGYSIGGIALDVKSATLFVGDRKKNASRLRLFDLATFKEKSSSGIDLGLPPLSLAVIR